ncbi:hypothetical protein HJ581_0044225 [Rhodococcus opacus]|nr:hypothetical protein HJ581_0044225 [Rhodococcus opacus]
MAQTSRCMTEEEELTTDIHASMVVDVQSYHLSGPGSRTIEP